MFRIALSALCADVVSPQGKQPGGYYPPLRTHRNFRSVIRWHRPCRGGYQPPANVTNFWAEPLHTHRGSNVANMPCFDIVPSNFNGKMFRIALSALCADVVSPQGKQPGGYYPPLRTHRNFRSVIRWHRPCRGGYQPPANVTNFWAEPLHTHRGSNVANMPCSDMIPPNFICKIFDGAIVGALRRRCFPHGETTGRILSAPTQSVPSNYRCKISVRCRGVAPYFPNGQSGQWHSGQPKHRPPSP